MITRKQLLDRILEGRLILVGEARGSRIEPTDIFDKESGKVIQKVELVYAVECAATFGTVLVRRSLPVAAPDLVPTKIGVEKGQTYAFELDRVSRKGGFVNGQLGTREPELVAAS